MSSGSNDWRLGTRYVLDIGYWMMESIEGAVALVIGIAVVFFVPALVWATVIAGLRQIVRDKIKETRSTQAEPIQEVQLNKMP